VRFFGGWDYAPEDADAKDVAAVGYKKGVPMGGDLTKAPEDQAPTFLVHSVKDPKSGNLDRIQVIKGWLDDKGEPQEKVYNVAASGDREIKNNKLEPVGNTVNLETGTYTNTIGDSQLATVWSDPDFDPTKRAFYYIRVLEIPTPRTTLFDTIALGVDPEESGNPATIQERAYTSPIWYTP
jgi:hypothetical protein